MYYKKYKTLKSENIIYDNPQRVYHRIKENRKKYDFNIYKFI